MTHGNRPRPTSFNAQTAYDAARYAMVGVGLAFEAQAWLTDLHCAPMPSLGLPTRRAIGFLVAGLLFGIGVRRPSGEAVGGDRPGTFAIARQRLFVASVLAYLTSAGFWLWRGETPVVLLTWVASVGLLLAACRVRSCPERPRNWESLRATLIPLGLILLVAVGLRLWRLDTLPLYLLGDAITDGLNTRAMLSGQQVGVIGFDAEWGRLTRTEYLPELATMFVFGAPPFGLYVSSVFMGVPSLLATYQLGAELYGKRVGLPGHRPPGRLARPYPLQPRAARDRPRPVGGLLHPEEALTQRRQASRLG